MTDRFLFEQIIFSIKDHDPFEVIYCHVHQLNNFVTTILGIDPVSGESILHLCLTWGQIDLFEYLLGELAERDVKYIDSIRPESGDTLLHRMCDMGNHALLLFMLDNFEWDVKKTNNFGISVEDCAKSSLGLSN